MEENFEILLYSGKFTTCGHLFINVPRSKVRDLATANGLRQPSKFQFSPWLQTWEMFASIYHMKVWLYLLLFVYYVKLHCDRKKSITTSLTYALCNPPHLQFNNYTKSPDHSDQCIFLFCKITLIALFFDIMLSTFIKVYHQNESYENSSLLYCTAKKHENNILYIFLFYKDSTIFCLDLIPGKLFLMKILFNNTLASFVTLFPLLLFVCGSKIICGSFLTSVQWWLYILCTLALPKVFCLSCFMFGSVIHQIILW